MLTEKEAVEAVQSAQQAYSGGRGVWPQTPVTSASYVTILANTAKVKERIARVHEYVKCLKEKRNEIVNLLM